MKAKAFTSPLSEAQLGIWLGQQMNQLSPMYNAAEYIILNGPIEKTTFEQALGQVISSTISLNLQFEQTDVGAKQSLAPAHCRLEHLDFSAQSHPSKNAQHWMNEDLSTYIDLQQGPLFKQALIKVSDSQHIWYQRIHHIACDGFGFALITQAVSELYTQLIEGKQCLANNGNQNIIDQIPAFDKMIDEDRSYHASAAYRRDKKFWSEKLKDQYSIPRLSSQSGAIADKPIRMSSVFSNEEFQALKNHAQSLKITWPETITACLALLIHQRTGAKDISIGLPVMNRLGSVSLKIPAMVMNIIPLRISLIGRESLEDIAIHIDREIKQCRMHQRYRYEHSKTERMKTHSLPLFGPVLNIMPFDRKIQFGRLEPTIINLSAGPVDDISFAFTLDSNNQLGLMIDANPNRYSEKSLTCIHQHLTRIISKTIRKIHQPIVPDTRFLSILKGPPLPNKVDSVFDAIYRNINLSPNALALQIQSKQLSYIQLAQEIATLSIALRQISVNEDSIIALALPRSQEAIVAMLAVLVAGAVFICIDPQAPEKRNRAILEDAHVDLIWVDSSHGEHSTNPVPDDFALPMCTTETLKEQTTLATLDATHNVWKSTIQQLAEGSVRNAYIIYTSGSTGTPKGVLISHRALGEFIASNYTSYKITAKDRVLQFAPFYFDACIEEIFVTLSHGASLILRNDAMLESMTKFVRQCAEWEISVLDLPTAFWHELTIACDQHKLILPTSLRAVIIGGEAVQSERVKLWLKLFSDTVRLYNTYGPSEATVIATCAEFGVDQHANKSLTTIGTPLAGRTAAVIGSNGELLTRGESGELLLLGAGLAEGYINQTEKTDNAFIDTDLQLLPRKQKAYRTGDRVLINEHDQIEYLGRLDTQVKISGYRIEPFEVETALLSLPDISEAAITIIQHEGQSAHIVAHVASPMESSITDIRRRLSDYLPLPMLPSQLISHTYLPKNRSGKIDREQLKSIAKKSLMGSVKENQELTSQQKTIVGIWSEVLGNTQISIDDNFFDIGGQSLQTIQVASRLSSALKKPIDVSHIFKHPSVRSLDQALLQSQTSAQPTINIQQCMQADCEAFEAQLEPAKNKSEGEAYKHTANRFKTVLLTGATGFVGAQLLHYLLSETEYHIICTVRENTEAAAKQRLHGALLNQSLNTDRCFLPTTPRECENRTSILLCDLAEKRLGLNNQVFQELGQTVDHIIHSAANTSVMRDYPSMRKVNALSTGELLKLASINNTPFNLVSTIAIAPPSSWENSKLPEAYIDMHSGLKDGYQQSKWVSEQFVSIAEKKGYNVSIYRLARVTGSSKEAYVNPKDLIWQILQVGLPLEKLPLLELQEPWTPVNKVAQFIIRHSLHSPIYNIFNLMPEDNLSFKQVLQWLAEAGATFTAHPLHKWCEIIKADNRISNELIVEFFSQRMSTDGTQQSSISLPTIVSTRFKAQAEIYRVTIPRTTQALFHQYFTYASAQSWFTPVQAPLTGTPTDTPTDTKTMRQQVTDNA